MYVRNVSRLVDVNYVRSKQLTEEGIVEENYNFKLSKLIRGILDNFLLKRQFRQIGALSPCFLCMM